MGEAPQAAGVGPRIVRAWFDTIVNPLLASLRLEGACVARKDWTWRAHRRDFDLIGPVADLLPEEGRINLEQFLEIQPEAARPVQEHDAAVARLGHACQELQDTLTRVIGALHEFPQATPSRELEGILLEIHRMRQEIEQLQRATPGGLAPLLAQYLVNHRWTLPPDYVTAKFWNACGDVYRRLLEIPSIRELDSKVQQAGTRLGVAVENLTQVLKDLRRNLSLKYDVPYITPSPASKA